MNSGRLRRLCVHSSPWIPPSILGIPFYVFNNQIPSSIYKILKIFTNSISYRIPFNLFSSDSIKYGFIRAQIEILSIEKNELKKVSWPTKQETTQTALGVVVIVVIIGILLWLFDMLLSWAIGTLYGVR